MFWKMASSATGNLAESLCLSKSGVWGIGVYSAMDGVTSRA